MRIRRGKYFWIDYKRYMKTPQWRNKREVVLHRAQYRCQCCKKREANQAHHLTYDRVGRERLSDLQAVCYHCHKHLLHKDKEQMAA